ncbi:phospholipase D gamma 1-like [Punica granatum]|uniref:Phospholipase D n=2 Tax=Punica granatum TaxID=22663 RepID=A0A218WIV7_PUNGR|nr:phospholipase D gamma 1-like [Punica granatum]OWM71972.1 hypothetical protein CDL15_Pgr017855 [Punica granatum]
MAKPIYSEMMSFGGSQHGQGQQTVPFKTSKQSLKVLLLHGSLDIWVKGARNLPNMDMFHKKLGDMFSRFPGKHKGKIEGHMSSKITSDPYVTICVSGAVIGRTFVIRNDENPAWEQHFHVPIAHTAAEVHFVVKDDDIVGSQIIGAVGIPVEQLVSNNRIEGTFPILGGNAEPCNPGAALSLSIQYTPVDKQGLYHQGVGPGPAYEGVPGTYFGLRKGGRVTLYQDAHVHMGSLPNFRLEGSLQYNHGSCWQDIFDTISQARRLVYITGWSVYHKVRLVRHADDNADYMLGNLLKRKSQEGVRVLVLVWDDPTSHSIFGGRTGGIMRTNDEETDRFFKHSSVQVLLCPRSAREGHSWLRQKETGTIYTHHQKTVIVDADAGNNKRKLIAFVGGLDLCLGRYDTPSHPIFRTLQTVHKDDYHNGTFTDPSPGAPRQAWHDLHCRIDGPAAYDMLTNFEERWLHASEPHGIQKLRSSHSDQLLKLERIPEILGVKDVSSHNEAGQEAWHIQVFRSIDSNSVNGFPNDPKHATDRNLLCGKNILIDASIHTAYIKAIRAAQHFLYIENQYFLGSSYNWDSYNDLGADNLIPMEIALKIASKIKANQRFSAYIVIPMWPEGVPTSAPIQRILFWQRKTMEMMYRAIYEALVEAGREKEYEPQDFLTFFCLGNMEGHDREGGSMAMAAPAPSKTQELAKKNRRFMIYVHSKGMIVDDEYLILGSANINQRSLEGTRDTEIAIGAYQPRHTYAKRNSYPKGQIHGYRMSLWAEHLGTVEECFKQPESLECMRRVRSLSELNWKQYAADEVADMKGHLLKYPLLIDGMGKVKPIPGCTTFPDVGGKIEGSFIAIQENLTI